MFAYCGNNPVCRKDILGNTSVEIFDSNGNGLSDEEEYGGSGNSGNNSNGFEVMIVLRLSRNFW